MILNFSTQKISQQLEFSNIVNPDFTINRILGYKNIISRKQWVLYPSNSIAKVYSYKVKQGIKQQQIMIENDLYKMIKSQDNNYFLIAKQINFDELSKNDIERLILQFGENENVAISYIINCTKDYQNFKQSGLQLLLQSEIKQKQDITDKVIKQYYNKQFKGSQLYQIPKYLKQTGNWDDKQTTKLSIKSI